LKSINRIWLGLIFSVSKYTTLTTKQHFSILCHSFDLIDFVNEGRYDMHALYIDIVEKLKRPYYPHFKFDIVENELDENEITEKEQDIAKYFRPFEYSLRHEFERQQIDWRKWEHTKINENYEKIKSYPRCLIIPTNTSTECLEGCLKFRGEGRFPTLTYYYHKNSASLCRCAQPLTGINSRNTFDEQFVEKIRLTGSKSMLNIVDLRPMLNMLYNSATGKGYESEKNYFGTLFKNFPIENIHALRKSYMNLLNAELHTKTDEQLAEQCILSKWFSHMKCILKSSHYVASKLFDGENVIIHCSDGWDRTSQVSALTQLMIDPYYRTFEGFLTLIYKDWIAFGHKFSERYQSVFCIASYISSDDECEFSPIFLLFLDSVRHLIDENTTEFEFSSNLLLFLHYECFTRKFKTLTFNNERDFLISHSSANCLFEYIIANKQKYINPNYLNPTIEGQQQNFKNDSNALLKFNCDNLTPWSELLKGSLNYGS